MKRFALVVASAALLFGSAQPGAQKSSIIEKIIVKVNGEIFTQGELEFRQRQAIQSMETNRQIKADDLKTDPGLIKALQTVTPDLLMDAVDELMLVQHGREIGVKFTEALFKDSIERLKQQNGIKDDAAFQAALKQEGVTLSELRVNIERAYMMNAVQQKELMHAMTLTEEEARQYYNTHLNEFLKPASVTLREIMIAVPTSTIAGQPQINVAADEAVKKQIEAIRERAVKGEDYAKLVGEVSTSGTKANGGLIGPVLTADLAPAMAAILDKLKPGEISEPIRTPTGYQLLKLESRTGAEPEVFEKSRDLISQKILEARLEVERNKFLDKLRTQAVIEWKDDTYKKMYDAGRAERTKKK